MWMRTLDRRKFLTVSAGVGLAVVAAACSSGTAADTEGTTRTVTHKKGTTEVPDNPQRIVTVGYSDQDTLLAFGRRPVGVTDWYGDYPDATWPWAQDALGGAHPEVFNRGQFTGEANFAYEAIAKLDPDLILALYIDVDDDAYQRLSAIAPTVTTSPDYPDFGMPWQDAVRIVGTTLGEDEKANHLVAGVDDLVAQQRAAHPEFEGKTVAVAELGDAGSFYVRSPNDPRSRLMTSLGFVVPEQIAQLAGDQDAFTISKEQFDIVDVDVLVWNVGSSPGAEATITADPVYQSLPVAKAGRAVFVDDPTVSGALTWGTVLSLPYAVEALVPKLADTAAKPA
ncbi:iron-siderophore ABC transporter substrate-binding protein [Rhodococcus wratislaviensis]|uniref:iron-siderophore ABC transporter substrate-binding protein n=1 Tax=Rhodococcus wratislaviensis TaxID=44752 RepID=UPI003517FF69